MSRSCIAQNRGLSDTALKFTNQMSTVKFLSDFVPQHQATSDETSMIIDPMVSNIVRV